ncbi:MAG: hypothetical protein LGB07_07405 [Sulfurovum sp.]|nr:hypothetical protein [Sulfurovum sp.]MCB4750412.1 hypothetical protein [Sulfurovum sp.]MCB4752336.1 hypothetical protein [Sulfurovum sp.]MCB4753219.1 hypothetical protein [Sulfurovum sp.]MCB4754355.1 hypothetical protein [Sulfurovum sp.]
MRIRLYIFVALLLIGVTGVSTQMINPNHFSIEVMGLHFDFPIAVWIVLPMLLLLLFTVIHMFYHSLKNYFEAKKWSHDIQTLEDAFYWSLMHEPKEQKYMVDEIKRLAVILSKSTIDMVDNVEGMSDRLVGATSSLNRIKHGEYVDLKEHKLARVFNEGNPHLIQNCLNRLKDDLNFVEEVINLPSSFSQIIQQEALKIFATKVTFFKARKYVKIFDVKNFMVMLNRATEDKDLGLSADMLNEFVAVLQLSCSDYIHIAKVTKKIFSPDENLALFRDYQQETPKAQNAYLYLLFEYELLDKIEAYFEEHEVHEFVKYRALFELKKQDKGFKLEDLIDTESICKNI